MQEKENEFEEIVFHDGEVWSEEFLRALHDRTPVDADGTLNPRGGEED